MKQTLREKKIVQLEHCLHELSTIDTNNEIIAEIKNKIELLKTRSDQKLSAWDRVNIARKQDRPTSLCYIEAIIDDFIELHGDRNFGDDKAIVGGIGFLNNMPVTVIGVQKGFETHDNILRNFGMPHPEGYRKALRLMKQAEKFKRPIITFVDTPGAYPGFGAEERGQGQAIATNLMEMMNLEVPIISIIIGEGGSGGALALAVGDQVWMMENSIYSILSPEGFASILYKDASKAPQAAEDMKITSEDILNMGLIDRVIDELDDINASFEDITSEIKENLINELTILKKHSKSRLLNNRYRKFRRFGQISE